MRARPHLIPADRGGGGQEFERIAGPVRQQIRAPNERAPALSRLFSLCLSRPPHGGLAHANETGRQEKDGLRKNGCVIYGRAREAPEGCGD